MTVRINVLKPFRFSQPQVEGQRIGSTQFFDVGEHDVDESIANHPWIKEPNLADGAIESPLAAAARVKAQKESADRAKAEGENATKRAEEAMQRLQRSQPMQQQTNQAANKDLNTPVGQLRSQQGEGTAQPVPQLSAGGAPILPGSGNQSTPAPGVPIGGDGNQPVGSTGSTVASAVPPVGPTSGATSTVSTGNPISDEMKAESARAAAGRPVSSGTPTPPPAASTPSQPTPPPKK